MPTAERSQNTSPSIASLRGGGIGYWAAGLQAWVGEGGRGGWARWQGLRPQAHGMTAMQVSAMQVSASSVNFN